MSQAKRSIGKWKYGVNDRVSDNRSEPQDIDCFRP